MKKEIINVLCSFVPENKQSLKNRLLDDFMKYRTKPNKEKRMNYGRNVRIMDDKVEFHNILKQYDFIPTSYVVKNQSDIIKLNYNRNTTLWFLKEPRSNRGDGVHVDTLDNLKKKLRGFNRYLLQRKIEPMLYDGRKGDTRFRMLVFNTDGTNDMYLHSIGLLRLARQKYNSTSKSKHVQLTNLSLSKEERYNRRKQTNPNPTNNTGDTRDTNEELRLISKDSFSEYELYLEEITKIATQIKNSYTPKLKVGKHNYFIGLDILVDQSGKFWLIEINPNPAFVMKGEFFEKCNKIQLRDTVRLYQNRYFDGKEEHGWIKL